MNFTEFYRMFDERFVPPERVQDIDQPALAGLLTNLCVKAFGEENIKTKETMVGRKLEIRFGDRKLTIYAETPREFNVGREILNLPGVYFSFQWQEEPQNRSTKDPLADSGYPVAKTIRQDTMTATHLLRDVVLKKLAEYALIVNFVAIGKRRESFYDSVLSSAGFQRVSLDTYAPVALLAAQERSAA